MEIINIIFSKMSKLFAVMAVFLSSLFIAINANSSLIELNNKNLLISYGGGGGNSPKAKAKKIAKKEKAKLLFKRRQAAKKAFQGIALTEEEKKFFNINKISEYEIKKY